MAAYGRVIRIPQTLSVILAFLLLAVPAAAQVQTPEVFLDDPAKEARVQNLAGQLRCPVCAGQSVRDSDAPLAIDIRQIIRERVASGQSDEQIVAYMRTFMMERYGEEALQNPPLKGNTLILWFAPLLILGAGLVLALRLFGRSATGDDEADMEPRNDR